MSNPPAGDRQQTASAARPTMADIADRLGISRPLVSIVLRNAPGASAATRERVLRLASELGYTPHQGAQSLRRTRSAHLGVTFEPAHASEPEIVESIYTAAAERGYQVMLSAQTGARDQRRSVDELLSYRCAAIIDVGPELAAAELAELARRAVVPLVVVGPGRRNPAYDVVRADGAQGVAAVVDHLATLGHDRVAYLHCPTMPSAVERLGGFTSAARRADLHPEIVEIVDRGYTEEAGSEGARHLLQAPALPTALVAGNDQQAVGALWVLARTGLRVPEEISVAGYDDTRYARLSAVDLTTASQDTRALGRRAVAAALRRIEEPGLAAELVVVESHLVVRGSTARPPRPEAVRPGRGG